MAQLIPVKPAEVSGMAVRRALPRIGRRMVGPWCFADHFGPADVEESPMVVPQHPHMGLQTVTWLLDGEVVHRDSLGSEQAIRPGQLNLMSAGVGVAHTEESMSRMHGRLHGAQLWIAQPDATRNSAATFHHHDGLPVATYDAATVTVMMGTFDTHESPARRDSPLAGVEVKIESGRVSLPLDAAFEYGVLVLRGAIGVDGVRADPSQFAYLDAGRSSIEVHAYESSVFLLLGGEPFAEKIYMWWNFVGRSAAEVTSASAQWQSGDDRFGVVAGKLARIAAPAPPGYL